MTWHLIEGEPGCVYARENDCVAVVVHTLRASTTAAMLLSAGATEIHAVREVEEALVLQRAMPEAILFGERGGLPPEGFDRGNSPGNVGEVAGKTCILCTTSGTARVLDAQGAAAVYMGTVVNASAVVKAAMAREKGVVLIPAGRAGDPEFDAHEDWVGAVAIANLVDVEIGEGAPQYREARHLIELDGVAGRIEASTHARRLHEIGLGDDVAFSARLNITSALPEVTSFTETSAILRNANA